MGMGMNSGSAFGSLRCKREKKKKIKKIIKGRRNAENEI